MLKIYLESTVVQIKFKGHFLYTYKLNNISILSAYTLYL